MGQCKFFLSKPKPKRVQPTHRPDSLSRRRKKTIWRQRETEDDMRTRFIAEGTLPPDCPDEYLQLRALLSEPIGQKFIGDYAKSILTQESFFCWVDIQEYRSIPTADYRRSKATHIYSKYIKKGAVLELGFLSPDEKTTIHEMILSARLDMVDLSSTMLDDIQQKIFINLYSSTFLNFLHSSQYAKLQKLKLEIYNHVEIDDFRFFDTIGEGGFAKVIRVQKKTTGKFYALKLQRKKDLVDLFVDDPLRLNSEKTVFAACHHPFIVNLEYSIQTPTCAILILGLANAGNLQDVINSYPDRCVDLYRVVFYAAEIILALQHLHDLKLMYRDLKPANVLLCEDGHIQLADMGGVADCGGSVLTREDGYDPRLMQGSDGRSRRRSIMGTKGYMAPEMIRLIGQHRFEKVGYTNAVDYWSLGITIFKLLSGRRPFDRASYEKMMEDSHQPQSYHQNGVEKEVNREYRLLLQDIEYPSFFPAKATSLIKGLLEVDEDKRLGVGSIKSLKKHGFFLAIEWDKLAQKHIVPPFIPQSRALPTKTSFDDFESFINNEQNPKKEMERKIDWMAGIEELDQLLFKEWDFISPHTLKIELGIAGEMETHDTNFKVQNLVGGGESPTSKTLSPLSVARRIGKEIERVTIHGSREY